MRQLLLSILLIAIVVVVYRGWQASRVVYPVEYGVSFHIGYTEWLGLNWRDTYRAMLRELSPKYIRIAAEWNAVEKKEGEFDFTDVDWMMDEAAKARARVTLVIGQKSPRWPECYIPSWWQSDGDRAEEQLHTYIRTVVERYKHHPAMEFWQVENEPYILFNFGACSEYQKDFLPKEIALVQSLDSEHKTIVTDSGELSTWRKASVAGDYFGTTVYRVVRDKKERIWSYRWLPSVVYTWRAALWGRDLNTFFVSELQAEPWFGGAHPADMPIETQEETMNPERLVEHMDFVTHIGVPRAYLWGVEWWYWMKEIKGDGRYWDVVKKRIEETNDRPFVDQP